MRATWPDRPGFVAIDGKTSRRSHDRSAAEEAIHLVPAFATTSQLVLGQEAVPGKASELAAIPVLLARLAEHDGLHGALVSIDAIATNATIARAIRDAGAHDLLAVKADQPGRRTEVEACFKAAPDGTIHTHTTLDKGHGATNMAVVRHFALNLVHAAKDTKPIKLRRKIAAWTPDYLEHLLACQAS